MSSPAPTYPTSLIEDSELTTLGFLPLIQPGTGLIYSEKTAWPFGERDADLLQSEINFEANIKSAVIVYPYLVAFSNHVIEIRHLETVSSFLSCFFFFVFNKTRIISFLFRRR
jgi:hypothetical protein